MNENTAKRPRAPFTPLLLVLLIAAAAVRALFWMDAGDLSLFQEPTGFGATYVLAAQQLETEGLSAPSGAPYPWAPLYPMFLRTVDALGLGLGGVRAIQFLLGVLGTGMLWILGWRLAGKPGAVVAALGGAVYGPFVFFEAELLPISLAIFFLEVALVLWGRPRWAVVTGFLVGLAALTQPSYLIAGALAAALSIALPGRMGWSTRPAAVLLAVGLLLPPSATLARNLAASGQPVLISVGGGVHFYIGNNPSADGTLSLPRGSGLLHRPQGLFESAREVAEADRGRPLSDAGVDRYWWIRGADFWIGYPGRALGLTLGKVMKALNDTELPGPYDYGYIREKVTVLRVLPTMGWLLPFGALGLIVSWRHRRFPGGWLFLFFLLSVIPFFVTGGHRLPLAVFLWPAAGVAVERLWSSRRDRLRLARLGVVVVAYAVFANLPLDEASGTRARALNAAGMVAMQKGDLREAREAFERAAEADPNHAETLNNLAFVHQQLGDIRGALLTYRRALIADPLQAETYMNLEELYRNSGRHEDALRILDEFEKARGGRVEDQAGQLELRRGMNALALGDTARAEALLGSAVGQDSALKAAARAVALAPQDHRALIAYAEALEQAGDTGNAIETYLRAVESGHKDVDLFYHLGQLLVDAGRGPEGERFLLAANEGRPHHEALWALGRYYEQTGRPDEAVTPYAVLVRLKAPHAEEAQARLEAIRKTGRDGGN